MIGFVRYSTTELDLVRTGAAAAHIRVGLRQ